MGVPMKTILCVDDDADDILLLKEAISKIDAHYQIVEAADGVEALSVLHQMNDKDDLPCLIVLDINMPRKDGKQTLVEIQDHPTLSNIPVVLFTTSSSSIDIRFSEQKHVELITKPIDVAHLAITARRLLDYCNPAA